MAEGGQDPLPYRVWLGFWLGFRAQGLLGVRVISKFATVLEIFLTSLCPPSYPSYPRLPKLPLPFYPS